MDSHDVITLVQRQAAEGRPFLEFLRSPSLSAGIYTLRAGEQDRQSPHSEDEIYYVINGRAVIDVGGEKRAVAPGTVVFVGAHVAHHFEDISDDLTVLVVFAPPFSG